MKVSLKQGGGSIITSSYTPVMVTPGAYGSGGGGREVPASIPQARAEAKEDKKSDKGITEKDLLEALKGLDGLPNDVNFVINKIQSDLNLARLEDNPFSSGNSSGALTNTYLNGLKYINQVKHSNSLFKNAYEQSKSEGSLNEVAITPTGNVIVEHPETGAPTTISAKEYMNYKGQVRALTNGELLELRRTNPSFKFSDDILSIVENGVGSKKVYDFIQSFISGLGKDKLVQEGYSQYDAQQIVSGIAALREATTEGADLSQGLQSLINNSNITETQVRQIRLAVDSINRMLPDNYRTLLAINSRNYKDPQAGVESMLLNMVTSKTSSVTSYKNKSGGSNGSGGANGPGGDKVGPAQLLHLGMGETTKIKIHGNGAVNSKEVGYEANVTSMPIVNRNGDALGATFTLDDFFKSAYSGMFDAKQMSMGNGYKIDSGSAEHVVITNNNIKVATLPYKRLENGDIVPDFDVLRQLNVVQQTLAKEYKIDSLDSPKLTANDKQVINKVLRQKQIPAMYDEKGELVGTSWRRFGMLDTIAEGTAITKDGSTWDPEDEKVEGLMEVTDGEYTSALGVIRKKLNDYTYEPDEPGIFGWETPAFGKGIIYIPVTNDYNKVNAGAGNKTSVQNAMANNAYSQIRNRIIEIGGDPSKATKPITNKTSFN